MVGLGNFKGKMSAMEVVRQDTARKATKTEFLFSLS